MPWATDQTSTTILGDGSHRLTSRRSALRLIYGPPSTCSAYVLLNNTPFLAAHALPYKEMAQIFTQKSAVACFLQQRYYYS